MTTNTEIKSAERSKRIAMALSAIKQDYSPDCLRMASTPDYVADAVGQLIDAGLIVSQPVGAVVAKNLLKDPQLLRLVRIMDEANHADDFGKRAREAFEELCDWIAALASRPAKPADVYKYTERPVFKERPFNPLDDRISTRQVFDVLYAGGAKPADVGGVVAEKGNPIYDWAILAIGELAIRDIEASVDLAEKFRAALAAQTAAPRQPLAPMGEEGNEWYFDCDGQYIDVKCEDGKYSIFFCNRKDGGEAWLDQAEQAPAHSDDVIGEMQAEARLGPDVLVIYDSRTVYPVAGDMPPGYPYAVGGRAAPVDLSNADEVIRMSDQSVRIRFMSARSASEFERVARTLLAAASK